MCSVLRRRSLAVLPELWVALTGAMVIGIRALTHSVAFLTDPAIVFVVAVAITVLTRHALRLSRPYPDQSRKHQP